MCCPSFLIEKMVKVLTLIKSLMSFIPKKAKDCCLSFFPIFEARNRPSILFVVGRAEFAKVEVDLYGKVKFSFTLLLLNY